MGKKLFVGSLSWDTTDESLRQAFEAFGTVREARVILDRNTNKSRGFGFVTFNDDAEAEAAIAQMNGAMLDGRTIRVNEAEERRGGGPRRRSRDLDDPQATGPSASAPRSRNLGPSHAEIMLEAVRCR